MKQYNTLHKNTSAFSLGLGLQTTKFFLSIFNRRSIFIRHAIDSENIKWVSFTPSEHPVFHSFPHYVVQRGARALSWLYCPAINAHQLNDSSMGEKCALMPSTSLLSSSASLSLLSVAKRHPRCRPRRCRHKINGEKLSIFVEHQNLFITRPLSIFEWPNAK